MSGLEEGTPGPFSSFSARPVSLRGFILNALPSRLPISNNHSIFASAIVLLCLVDPSSAWTNSLNSLLSPFQFITKNLQV